MQDSHEHAAVRITNRDIDLMKPLKENEDMPRYLQYGLHRKYILYVSANPCTLWVFLMVGGTSHA